jgi:hypothetical protein
MTTVNVEVLLKDTEQVAVEAVLVPHGAPETWNEDAVRHVMVEMLRAIERVNNPQAPRDRPVLLTGFNFIVEPVGDKVMLALMIPMGVAAAGPLAVDQAKLDVLVSNVLQLERSKSSTRTVH